MSKRGSEPARYEDKLRARRHADPMVESIYLKPEERDALADAVEALRDIKAESDTQRTDTLATGEYARGYREAWLHAGQALGAIFARLDGLGG